MVAIIFPSKSKRTAQFHERTAEKSKRLFSPCKQLDFLLLYGYLYQLYALNSIFFNDDWYAFSIFLPNSSTRGSKRIK